MKKPILIFILFILVGGYKANAMQKAENISDKRKLRNLKRVRVANLCNERDINPIELVEPRRKRRKLDYNYDVYGYNRRSLGPTYYPSMQFVFVLPRFGLTQFTQNVQNIKQDIKYLPTRQSSLPVLMLKYNSWRQKRSKSKCVLNGHMKCVGEKGFECCYCGKQFKDGKNIRIHLDGQSGKAKRTKSSHNVDIDKRISGQNFAKLKRVTNKEVFPLLARQFSLPKPMLQYNSWRQKRSKSKYVLNGHMKCVGKEGFECCYCGEQFKNHENGNIRKHLDGQSCKAKRFRNSHNIDFVKHISEQDFTKLKGVTNKRKFDNLKVANTSIWSRNRFPFILSLSKDNCIPLKKDLTT